MYKEEYTYYIWTLVFTLLWEYIQKVNFEMLHWLKKKLALLEKDMLYIKKFIFPKYKYKFF